MLIRSVLFVAIIVFGASLPAMSLQGKHPIAGLRDSEFTSEDDDVQENPILELDAERSYKSEALLSYKSTIAPYGKIIGIRSTLERAFTPVRTWQDVQEFVSKITEERVIVRILEPWGTELVTGVTVNRKSYPVSNVRPVEPPKDVPARDPFEKADETSPLNPANPAISIPSGTANRGRISLNGEPPKLEALAIEPKAPSRKSNAKVDMAQYAYEATLLSLAIFAPSSVTKSSSDARSHTNYVTVRMEAKAKSQVKSNLETDEGTWLQESLDLADRLGLLSAKPLVTSDRRQRAFAIYTLYMALKELRMQVDLDARRLNTALDRMNSDQATAEDEHSSLVKLARSFERSMSGIMMWDAEAMMSAVRGYRAELQAMDSARVMLAFLSKVKKQPEISSGYRAYSGGSFTQH